MFHQINSYRWLTTVAVTLLVGHAAETSDSRIVDAARNQDQKTVRALLNQKVDVNARSSDGSTALLWLAHWNDPETAHSVARGRRRRQRRK